MALASPASQMNQDAVQIETRKRSHPKTGTRNPKQARFKVQIQPTLHRYRRPTAQQRVMEVPLTHASHAWTTQR